MTTPPPPNGGQSNPYGSPQNQWGNAHVPPNQYGAHHPQLGQPQYGAHPVQEKPKKGGCLKWGAIGLGAIVVLAVLGSMLGGGDDATSTAADETTTTATTTTDGNDAAAPAPDAPAPAAADAAPAEQEPAEEDVPAEFKSALRKADTYANTMHMSKAGLYDQLTSEYGESFSPEAAQYAVDNVEADWNNNALEKARTYQDLMAMSPDAIRDQLTSEYGEKFTPEEAEYAIANL